MNSSQHRCVEFVMDEIFLFLTGILIGTLHCVARLLVEDDLIKENSKDERRYNFRKEL